ncbi:hypothetical protein P1J78_07225 [Psychromarinibacter sp. C21-152]|uniref:Uncharacterized protein n=1 Tax=Psychromarinibacter sediminicola TaxID=3033385 RepID=A0AAE3T7T7_9RHOB|nr:hypothetical protein [Psychromarinibacter sediminicola]MDF0600517.1 hypothetical protein [Psychromarinibacter sediminicola]
MARAWHHLPVSALAVLWNLLLVGDYLGLRLRVPLYVSNMTPEQVAWYEAMPLWMSVAWGVAVWSGLFAALLLVSRMATGTFFALSFLGWLVLGGALMYLREPSLLEATGEAGVYMMAAAAVAAFLFFVYARWMRARLRH